MAEQDDPPGLRPVSSGIIRSAKSRLKTHENRDPTPGEKRNGVAPGGWRPPDGSKGLPPDCPVKALGKEGTVSWVIDSSGELCPVPSTGFGINFAQMMFAGRANYLLWGWPRFGRSRGNNQPPPITGFQMNDLRDDLYHSCAEKGVYHPAERVRGRGAWTLENGALVLHCGHYLWVGGRMQRAGIELEGFFYPRLQPIPVPSQVAPEEDENLAPAMLDFLRTWNWKRPGIDPLLMLGWIGAGFLGGALPWRPSVFVVGDKAVGKSHLQGAVKIIFGPAIVSTPDTTPAGIYQRIHHDALPVAIDELEADGTDGRRVQAVIKLARLSASGGIMLRGGADHHGVEFQARSTFLFSAINPPWMSPQDLSRIVLLSMGPLDPQKTGGAPLLPGPVDTIAPRFLRRLADAWPRFAGLYEDYRTALRAGGHEGRSQDTYSTFLAAAHLLLGDYAMEGEGLPIEAGAIVEHWRQALPVDLDSEGIMPNWRRCLEHLLSGRIEVMKSGAKPTVGGTIELAMRDPPGSELANVQRETLQHAGLDIEWPGNKIAAASHVLYVPNDGQAVAEIFAGSEWGGSTNGGVWSQALRQGPADIIVVDRNLNQRRIAGVKRRCTMVVLEAYYRLT